MRALTLAFHDTTTMIGRELKHTRRFPLLLVGTIMVPVVMLLLFDYILGGPIGHGLGNAAHGAPYVEFLLPFLSSTFVPADSLPAGVRWFAAHQPFTPVVESLRALLTGAPVGSTAYLALAWCAVIALAGYVWAQVAFHRATR